MKSILSDELPAQRSTEAKPRYIPQVPFEFAAQISALMDMTPRLTPVKKLFTQ